MYFPSSTLYENKWNVFLEGLPLTPTAHTRTPRRRTQFTPLCCVCVCVCVCAVFMLCVLVLFFMLFMQSSLDTEDPKTPIQRTAEGRRDKTGSCRAHSPHFRRRRPTLREPLIP